MNDLRFRSLNFDNHDELLWLAEVYRDTPRQWHIGWSPSVSLETIMDRILACRTDPDRFAEVAENEEGVTVGFHWVGVSDSDPRNARYIGFRVPPEEKRIAQIYSLWVHEAYRGKGIACELKRRGEAWAKSRGATRIETSVHFQNKRMLEINFEAGFEAGNIAMSKPL